MPQFGRNPYPKRYGGGLSTLEAEHIAMLDALAPGWDVTTDTLVYAEAYADAVAITAIWRINGRLRNSLKPLKMLDTLTTWEEACNLRPTPTDTVQDRRRRVAAKFRGLVGNAISDIYDACAELLDAQFLGLVSVSAANQITYWPGMNPGPPGYEWSSNRAIIGVRMSKSGLSDTAFLSLRNRCFQMLDALVPAWMTFQIGVGTGFIVNQGIVGQTFL